jgi:hypothetical protein
LQPAWHGPAATIRLAFADTDVYLLMIRTGSREDMMVRRQPQPPMEGLRRQISKGRREGATGSTSTFVRETFVLPRMAARAKAREWLDTWPKAAYWTEIETWRQLPDDRIEFTMRRLPTAD